MTRRRTTSSYDAATNCYNNSAVGYVVVDKVVQLLAGCPARIFTMCDAKPRRHTRPVPRLFSQWYDLVHNSFVKKIIIEKQNTNFKINKIRFEILNCL